MQRSLGSYVVINLQNYALFCRNLTGNFGNRQSLNSASNIIINSVTDLTSNLRRLAAVMFTDIVGYTSLTQKNEAHAMSILREHNELMRSVFREYNGREVKTIGDSFLVEFPSALEATLCAVEIQKRIHKINENRKEEERISVRIGIHVGDVIVNEGDILGDTVNIASRIYPLAEPGGICFTDQVASQVSNKIPYKMVKLQNFTLKHVNQNIGVYSLIIPWKVVKETTSQPAERRLAVLPFGNISPDPSDKYFADGMTEEIINTLSHIKELGVIARTSVMRYENSIKSIAEIGEELRVGWILEGSVRKAGNRVRVTVQLIRTSDEEHVWSENYDRQLEDIFAIQSDIAHMVAEALKVRVLQNEKEMIKKSLATNAAAYLKYLKGREALRDRTETSLLNAKKFFKEAIALDSNYAPAYVGLADATYLYAIYYAFPFEEPYKKTRDILEKALMLNENLAEAHATMGTLLDDEYKFDEAEREYKRAIDINPDYATVHNWYAMHYFDIGRVEEAKNQLILAADSDPFSVVISENLFTAYIWLGWIQDALKELEKLKELDVSTYKKASVWLDLITGEDEKAASRCEELVNQNPDDSQMLAFLCLIHRKLGQRDKLHSAFKKLESLPLNRFYAKFWLGVGCSAAGKVEEALELFEKSYQESSLPFRYLRMYIVPEEVRKHQRFIELFKKAKVLPIDESSFPIRATLFELK